MAGTAWTRYEKAIIIWLNKRGFLDKVVKEQLHRFANKRRTLTAIRSQLAELRKNPTIYNARRRTWNEEAVLESLSKTTMSRKD
ncbi:hypothetical protein E8E12_000857 [Didymella heteroderae]|uniref:Uncharacterized protein n=1 Tax=Didymella heteroderae TaxID=1769908 RepID=A0A9P5BU57_9PLEO|nr:hypothetical protein E8E12_000857 [Didymella heteroderae]